MIGKKSLSSGSTNILFIMHLGILFCGWSQLRREIEIFYLLQPVKLPTTWHLPFHFDGGGPSPLSSKLGASI